MAKFITLRFLQGILVLLGIYAVTFFLVAATPGSPFSTERAIRPEILAQIEAFYGYDKPTWERFLSSLGNLLRGDFGPSAVYANRSVTAIIAESFPVSLKLGSISLAIAILLGVPAGILAAVKKNTWLDYVPMSTAMAGICLPTFVMGPLLALVFGLIFAILPVAGWFGPEFVILPSATLGLYYAAYFARLTRGGMLEMLNQDWVRTARAKGVAESTIVWKHCLKGGLIPVITFLGPALAGIISGSFVVETIFQVPGLGQWFVKGALNRDDFLILGLTVLFAALIVLMNLLVDIAQVALNPRLKYD
ncbi:ABC transporter permease [Croceicoccus naphthovorans]|uniref:ABC transporter n=1 Tax=Croceicoccus naphthovorans TaxID=1348774 RepID=A0A0G3XGH5_9SPHN|nr:ABC transporter permease subunit [Croceicoccus naphthovorans]AKM09731.1 ABC transporter [Croceicoccus naphthovorans]MBB3990734.1 oligopeptide transport system permease protein [Croceicoccus naphthovorans]